MSAHIIKAHPDRQVKTTVIRATLKALVTQGRVPRTKRGRSVFYTSVTQPEEAPSADWTCRTRAGFADPWKEPAALKERTISLSQE